MTSNKARKINRKKELGIRLQIDQREQSRRVELVTEEDVNRLKERIAWFRYEENGVLKDSFINNVLPVFMIKLSNRSYYGLLEIPDTMTKGMLDTLVNHMTEKSRSTSSDLIIYSKIKDRDSYETDLEYVSD